MESFSFTKVDSFLLYTTINFSYNSCPLSIMLTCTIALYTGKLSWTWKTLLTIQKHKLKGFRKQNKIWFMIQLTYWMRNLVKFRNPKTPSILFVNLIYFLRITFNHASQKHDNLLCIMAEYLEITTWGMRLPFNW